MNRITQHFFNAPTGVFTQPEVAVAINGSDFSRHGLVKRALANGEILDIRRGLYCLAPRYQKKPVSVYGLAQRVYGPSYISLETALSYHGWIPEAVYACTCVSYGRAKEFTTPLGLFSYKRVPQRIFYAGVERCVDPDGNTWFMASPAKALADYVYVHRPSWTTVAEASASLRIEADELTSPPPDQLDVLADNYLNRRVRRFLASWKEALSQ
jgi:predicted transcriptional regulator of viral defense system